MNTVKKARKGQGRAAPGVGGQAAGRAGAAQPAPEAAPGPSGDDDRAPASPPLTWSVSMGAEAYAALAGRLQTYTRATMAKRWMDARLAAGQVEVALGVARDPAVKAAVDALGPNVIEPGVIDDLGRANAALWYADAKARTAASLAEEGPEVDVLLAEGQEIRVGLAEQLAYLCKDEPEVKAAAKLAMDDEEVVNLPGHLAILGAHARARSERVENDPVGVPGRVKRAGELADAIAKRLSGVGDPSVDWALERDRCFHLVAYLHAELRFGLEAATRRWSQPRTVAPLRTPIDPKRRRPKATKAGGKGKTEAKAKAAGATEAPAKATASPAPAGPGPVAPTAAASAPPAGSEAPVPAAPSAASPPAVGGDA